MHEQAKALKISYLYPICVLVLCVEFKEPNVTSTLMLVSGELALIGMMVNELKNMPNTENER